MRLPLVSRRREAQPICTALQQHGFPAADLTQVGPGASDPLATFSRRWAIVSTPLPVWSRKASELFYRSSEGMMLASVGGDGRAQRVVVRTNEVEHVVERDRLIRPAPVFREGDDRQIVRRIQMLEVLS